ncbi:hypothetical protein MHZ36_13325 [Staphylococcus sp. ACRSN]|uniref:hypothetical protein n=1 Tax=Staphylococcus sp. ACRSN TaxID=2918214 RepID=UPI001EF24214|nr:hypothetical protein [Staphylococcus sp. ACRSN]MCG7340266.1 hypothetical protein [Staphylococcus sp. ACRSN]
MYNTLTVKTDILELGNLHLSKPDHIHFFSKMGYKIYESHRIFDEVHELNVMLGRKKDKCYIIVSNPENTVYQTEEFKGVSLSKHIRFVSKEGLKELKCLLKNDSTNTKDFLKKIKSSDFRNQMQICINDVRLKSILLSSSIFLLCGGTFIHLFL